jgi:hypothetical protein
MRYLLYYKKLDLYHELQHQGQADILLTMGWIDVTDDPVHEKLYQLYQAQK